MNQFEELFQKYNCDLKDEQVQQEVQRILADKFAENNTPEVYKTCLSLIDLTSLNGTDTDEQIEAMTAKVNDFQKNYPGLPNVGAICVYPSMVHVVKNNLQPKIGIASVAAGFPASQTFIEVKVAETSMAVMEGASEIDVVISIGKFLSGRYDEVREELQEIKAACRGSHLKVILESGALQSASNIKKASVLSMSAGADFIKTSTGKIPVAATPEATYIMCTAIRDWHEKTGDKIGYKPAGGIVTTEDAVKHYTIVKEILGEEWLNNKLFRIGASRLANNLLTDITGKEVKYF
ncbi:MAG: deoxyribose-phosphate aldolase [Paludibacter sp.]|jgi:deoxyribose-phosphate aldolase|nr:deoxyribose-phosphate aldolase [Paludibacter sp.]